MKENKIIVIINKSVEEVFEFTTNPENTHKRISGITKEIANEYPPRIGTIYKNHGNDSDWDFYKVIEFEENKIFTLSDLDDNYHVRYTYKAIQDKTEMEYFEWMTNGDLSNPYTKDVLEKLKSVIENN